MVNLHIHLDTSHNSHFKLEFRVTRPLHTYVHTPLTHETRHHDNHLIPRQRTRGKNKIIFTNNKFNQSIHQTSQYE
jgi:hypothetical protein